jgi:NAD+--asparagine ADP-ribosyltransferase
MAQDKAQALNYINGVINQLSGLYVNAYSDVLKLIEIRNIIETGNADFTFQGNTTAENKLNDILKTLSGKTENLIRNGITGAWKLGENETKDAILKAFGKEQYSKEVNTTMEQAVKDHRAKGMSASQFYNQKRGGMTLSARVWNLNGNARTEIETIIQNGILQGKSADEISRSIKGYLNEPDKLFRRVRNKDTGALELSKAAKKYHPGQGVYRSSYKNAMRLALTEINMAYRRAEWESYQQNPLIKGYQIRLSNNHTTLIKGVATPFRDICDDLQGEYPKEFLWVGWHPQCRCAMIPITVTREEMKERMIARRDNKLDEWKPKDEITEPPKALNEWMETNRKRIENAKQLPFWYIDNYKLLNIPNVLKPTVIAEPTPNVTHQANESVSVYSKVEKTEEEIRMNRNFETAVCFDKDGNILIDKRGGATSVAFTNDEVAKMKDGILTHNHPGGWRYDEKSLKRIGNSLEIK